MDALSEVLRLARLSGAVLIDAHAHGSWCVAVPPGASSARMFAHVVVEGECRLKAGDENPVVLESGDFALVSRGEAHLIGSDLDARAVSLASLQSPPMAGDLEAVTIGAGGSRTRWLALAFTCDRHLAEPLLTALPIVFRADLRGSDALRWLPESLGFSLSVSDAPRAGAGATAARLSELALVEALRRHVQGLPRGGTGWLAGLNDRYVGRALALVHGRPSEDWTVEKLARQVGLSRSALAERFSDVMGEPVFAFLTRWRLQLAAEELLTTPRTIAAIAHAAGYESAGAFSFAFKRSFGKPPSVWRKKAKRRVR
jgi:AraC family transcriptional regulator, alkane utilization regulator